MQLHCAEPWLPPEHAGATAHQHHVHSIIILVNNNYHEHFDIFLDDFSINVSDLDGNVRLIAPLEHGFGDKGLGLHQPRPVRRAHRDSAS